MTPPVPKTPPPEFTGPTKDYLSKLSSEPWFRNVTTLPFRGNLQSDKGLTEFTIDWKKFSALTRQLFWGSPFAARYLGPIANMFERLGLPSAANFVSAMGVSLGCATAAEIGASVLAGLAVGVPTGIGLNYELPKAGNWLGQKAFEVFGPPAADSWIWTLDNSFVQAFDSKKTVGDTIAKGIKAVAGRPSGATMDTLDRMGFGGWSVFKNSWGID